MAEARKPARKKPVKRGPTKAAALKALGLTQEDLDALKSLREQQASPAQTCTCEGNSACSNCPPERIARLDHKARSVEASATLKASSDPQEFLEDREGPQRVEGGVPQVQEEPTWYMRNLRYTDVGFRLTRQTKQGEKRTNLKPRGQRGDMVKLEPGDLKDAELQTQVAYGLVEVIPEGEALEALRKQYTNRQAEVPAHIAMLRNPLGEEYNTAPRTVSDEESMGYKVADLDPRVMQGKLSDKEIKRDAGIRQGPVTMEPVQNPSPGKIISDGFMAPVQKDMSSDNERQAEIDAKLRAKQFEERPEDNLGVKVTLGETQRVQ